MKLQYEVLMGLGKLDLNEFIARQQYVDTNGDPLSVSDLVAIWAVAVDEGITSVDELIEEFGLTDKENLAIVSKVTMQDIRDDYADIEKNYPGTYSSFNDYWNSFPTRIALPGQQWLVWGE